jgi:hypothetical protein
VATFALFPKILGIKSEYRACARRQKSVRQFKARAERSVKITTRGIAMDGAPAAAEGALSLAFEPNKPAGS